jgi:hypothetical protein
MRLPEHTLKVLHFEEPPLEFAYRQTCVHPKDGLFLFGPHNKGKKSKEIRVGAIGTEAGIKHFQTWGARLLGPVMVPEPKKTDKPNRLHLANFPGLEEAFGLHYSVADFATYTVDEKALDEATKFLNHHEAVSKAVALYVDKVRKHSRNEESAVDVWVLVLPELIFDRCKPQSRRTGLSLVKGDFAKRQKAPADLPLLQEVVDLSGEEIFDDIPDFHRQAKAEFLKLGFPSQLLRETTLAPEAFVNKAGYPVRMLQDPATVAWNIATGLYYKTQPTPPWKLAGVRPGVCYVGLVYKLLPNHPQEHACCAAQMFLSEGDGVVFRGANGPWKTGDYEYHLKAPAAKTLIQTVLDTYAEKHGGPPRELFIHGRTNFNDEEWAAFVEAAPDETNIVGVRIQPTRGEMKLFRDGDYPVLRGTALILDDRNAYFWTNGYLPQLDTYIGPETPNPLHISVLRAKNEFPDIETVLRDILGLTKINYNACNFNDGLPVTVRFADKVGDVLVMGSARDAERQPFKFYI